MCLSSNGWTAVIPDATTPTIPAQAVSHKHEIDVRVTRKNLFIGFSLFAIFINTRPKWRRNVHVNIKRVAGIKGVVMRFELIPLVKHTSKWILSSIQYISNRDEYHGSFSWGERNCCVKNSGAVECEKWLSKLNVNYCESRAYNAVKRE